MLVCDRSAELRKGMILVSCMLKPNKRNIIIPVDPKPVMKTPRKVITSMRMSGNRSFRVMRKS
jgi:hypothetical protein